MSVNKVVYAGKTLVDMTGATATAAQILSGYTAYGKSGAILSGTTHEICLRVFAQTSQPSSPREGDVWVITSTALYYCEFDHWVTSCPTWTATSGWIYIGCFGVDETKIIEATRTWGTVGVRLSLGGCWQNENGTWSAKNAYVYRNGAWVKFSSSDYIVFGTGASYSGGWTGLGNVTSVGSTINCYVDYSWAGCQVFSNGSFNVTNFSKLYVNIGSVTSLRDQASFGLSASKPNSVMWNDSFTNKSNCAAIQSITSAGVKVIDISSLSGNYYFWCGQNGTGWSGQSGFQIATIWLT